MGKSVIVEKAKKVSEEQGQMALFSGLAIFTLIFPLWQYVWPYHIIGNQVQSVFLLGLAIYFLCVLGIEYINHRLEIRRVSLFSVVALMVFGVISCLCSESLNSSVYGDELQGQGFLVIFSYYIIFLAATQLKNKTYRKRLMQYLILLLGFIAVYGVLQFLQIPVFRHKIVRAAVYPARNQNFYAVYPVLFTGLMLVRLMYGDNGEDTSIGKKILSHLSIVLGFAACLSSDSLLVYMGLIMEFLLLLFLELVTKRHRYGKALLILMEFLLVFFLFDIISGGQMSEEVLTLSNQIEQEGTLLGDYVGTGRMRLWKETLKAIPGIWAFGCGVECTRLSYGMGDAHNEYLQLWAEQGVFALIAYLIFLFSLFIPGLLQFIKKEEYDSDFVSKAAMFAFFGYIAQAFANVRVVQVAPYFWLCCGLLYVRKQQFFPPPRKKD
ncbi:MAG: O-antigen ligase family protein [Lachnospiraceae bacterium]|nr:O-antigen ligase family protein [Lachnospiraceae bacterium]